MVQIHSPRPRFLSIQRAPLKWSRSTDRSLLPQGSDLVRRQRQQLIQQHVCVFPQPWRRVEIVPVMPDILMGLPGNRTLPTSG